MWARTINSCHANSNSIQPVTPVPLKHSSVNSNFEADVLESEDTAGKKESRLVLSISKLTKTARSGNKSLAWGFDGLLVSVVCPLIYSNPQMMPNYGLDMPKMFEILPIWQTKFSDSESSIWFCPENFLWFYITRWIQKIQHFANCPLQYNRFSDAHFA